jgi:hypothetical protein
LRLASSGFQATDLGRLGQMDLPPDPLELVDREPQPVVASSATFQTFAGEPVQELAHPRPMGRRIASVNLVSCLVNSFAVAFD